MAGQSAAGSSKPLGKRRRAALASALPPLPDDCLVPEAPSVWRAQERGESGWYMALIYQVDLELQQVHFLLPSGHHAVSLLQFASEMRPYQQPINPYRCILNFLSRLREGTVQMRVREERSLIAMLTKEELSAMSERELGAEYRRIMGKGPQRIDGARKEKAIEELLDKLRADASVREAAGPEAAEDGNGASQPKPRKNKEPSVRKPKEPGVKKEKAPKAPKAPRQPRKDLSGEVKEVGDWAPRAGTMKHTAYQVFIKTKGDRAATVEAAIKAGATQATANSWYGVFCKKSKPAA